MSLLVLLAGLLPLIFVGQTIADTTSRSESQVVKENGFVRVVQFGELNREPTWTYLITHGLNGTKEGDRFHVLARKISQSYPNAKVLLIDWSNVAAQKGFLGLPAVWKVSSRIGECGKLSSEALQELDLNPSRTTMIGESFGNFVNFEIAQSLGGVERMLCFNPANELGGYRIPDMTTATADCYSFQTVSMYDTQDRVSNHDMRLTLPKGMSSVKGHTYGITWLAKTLERSDDSWILCERQLPTGSQGAFAGTVSPSGQFDAVPVLRHTKKEVAHPTVSLTPATPVVLAAS